MDTIQKNLEDLGLSDKQTLVYSKLLDTGRGSAHRIAKETGLKRTTTYSVLGELQEIGLVHTIPGSSKNQFRPLSPALLVDRKKQRLQNIERSIPQIEARLKDSGSEDRPRVQFYEGIDGIRQIRDYKLEDMAGKTIFGFYATANKETQKEFGFMEAEEQKMIRLNIKAKGIAPEDPENLDRYRRADKKAGREIKTLPLEEYSSNVSIEIGEDWVKTNDFRNLQGLIIENQAFAETMRQIFKIVWKTVKSN